MAGNSRGDDTILPSQQEEGERLRPAELHGILRRLWERLAVSLGLKPADLYGLTRKMHTHLYAPGEVILPYWTRANGLGLIVRGQAAAYANQSQTSQQVAVLYPGSTFGNDISAANHPSNTALRALTRCEIWFLGRADLKHWINKKRGERWIATASRWMAWGFLGLAICLLALLPLGLPPVREAVALLPMGLGQWCSQRAGQADSALETRPAYNGCAAWSWTVAAKLAPSDANALLALGSLYYRHGDMEAARRAFETARRLSPEWAEVHNNLGLIYARQGEHDLAIAAFQQALSLEPGVAAAEHNLGFSLQALHADEEALAHYQQALALGEPQASTLVNMAMGYYQTGDQDKAASLARQSLKPAYSPGSGVTMAPAHALLGAVALESRQPEQALYHLRRAIALDPGYSPAYYYSGLAHEALNQSQEAIAALEQALAMADDEAVRVAIRQRLKGLYQTREP